MSWKCWLVYFPNRLPKHQKVSDTSIISIVTRATERLAALNTLSKAINPAPVIDASHYFYKPTRILMFADLHYLDAKDLNLLENLEYDACFFMGDNKVKYIEAIKKRLKICPTFGILGNHDNSEDLERVEIENLHGKKIEIGGIRFAGFEGGTKYRFGKGVMYDQDETISIAAAIPSADVLLSHDGPFHLYGTRRHHCGMKGITNYIQDKKPLFNFHGHYHINRLQQIARTTVVCHYKCAIYDFETHQKTKIF